MGTSGDRLEVETWSRHFRYLGLRLCDLSDKLLPPLVSATRVQEHRRSSPNSHKDVRPLISWGRGACGAMCMGSAHLSFGIEP